MQAASWLTISRLVPVLPGGIYPSAMTQRFFPIACMAFPFYQDD
jgi:hypothetical protein